MIIPIVIKLKMKKEKESQHDAIFESIETIIQEFKPSLLTSNYQFYTIYLLYRFSLAFCLVILTDSPSVQIFMIGIFQTIICKIFI